MYPAIHLHLIHLLSSLCAPQHTSEEGTERNSRPVILPRRWVEGVGVGEMFFRESQPQPRIPDMQKLLDTTLERMSVEEGRKEGRRCVEERVWLAWGERKEWKERGWGEY